MCGPNGYSMMKALGGEKKSEKNYIFLEAGCAVGLFSAAWVLTFYAMGTCVLNNNVTPLLVSHCYLEQDKDLKLKRVQQWRRCDLCALKASQTATI